jgi:hypothetical protein
MGPPWTGSSQYDSWYSMSRTCRPRDIISLVIPRIGDNRLHNYYQGGACPLGSKQIIEEKGQINNQHVHAP